MFKIARKTFVVLLGCCVCATVSLPKRVGADEFRATLPSPLTQEQLKQRYSIFSQADLDVVVGKLKQPATKIDALTTLIHFANFRLYSIGGVFMSYYDPSLTSSQNQLVNDLSYQAVKAIRANTNFDSISLALDSSDGDAQFWALRNLSGWGMNPKENWASLVPKINRLAVEGDPKVREAVVEEVGWRSPFREFLKSRINVETNPYVVLLILNEPFKSDRSQHMTPVLLRLLNSPDEEVRSQALMFIGSNYAVEPKLQVNFDPRVITKVVESAKSKSNRQKQAALFALDGLKQTPRIY